MCSGFFSDTEILVCDAGKCVYTNHTASRLPSAKHTGIPRCVRHGALLLPRAWASRMTSDEARKHLKELQENESVR